MGGRCCSVIVFRWRINRHLSNSSNTRVANSKRKQVRLRYSSLKNSFVRPSNLLECFDILNHTKKQSQYHQPSTNTQSFAPDPKEAAECNSIVNEEEEEEEQAAGLWRHCSVVEAVWGTWRGPRWSRTCLLREAILLLITREICRSEHFPVLHYTTIHQNL